MQCTSCKAAFHTLNRRQYCRLCGKFFCKNCSQDRALIPPSSIVLVPRDSNKVKPKKHGVPELRDDDPDRLLTHRTSSVSDAAGRSSSELLYGKGLEERCLLAREPLRVCQPCYKELAPLQEELRNSNSNAVRFNYIDPSNIKRLLNSPLAFTLGHEIRKAAYTLNNLLPLPRRLGNVMPAQPAANTLTLFPEISSVAVSTPSSMQQCKEKCSTVSPNLGDLDGLRIPARLLERAKGVAVITVVKMGLGFSGWEAGSGLVVARVCAAGAQSSQTQIWSAPSAIGILGLSWGALVGAQVSDHIFLLMTDDAVEMLFNDNGSVQLGADVGIALGPLGRAAEADVGASLGKVAPIYTYSLSKGLYAGISFDGKVVVTRKHVNERFYGRTVSAMEILQGAVPTPPAAQPLYQALQRCHVCTLSSGNKVDQTEGASHDSLRNCQDRQKIR